MKRTLQILNELERAGAMSRYAIGGAMGATFYAEPLLTFDLDIFVVLPQTANGLVTLAPLYDALRSRGYAEASGSHLPPNWSGQGTRTGAHFPRAG